MYDNTYTNRGVNRGLRMNDKVINVRIRADMLKMLEEYCRTNNYTRSDVIRWGILMVMASKGVKI